MSNMFNVSNPGLTRRLYLRRFGNCIHFRNVYVLLGWRRYDLRLLKDSLPIDGKSNVHIFLANSRDISSYDDFHRFELTINYICEECRRTKVTIHIPYSCSHIAEDNRLQNNPNIWKSVRVERKGVFFNISDPGSITFMPKDLLNEDLDIFMRMRNDQFDPSDQGKISSETLDRIRAFDIVKSPLSYRLHIDYTSNGVEANIKVFYTEMNRLQTSKIQTTVEQVLHPEENKDKIIANFKANTKLSILKGFRNEDDIWNFITTSSDKKEKEAISIHQKNRVIRDQSKSMLEQIISEE